MKGRKNKYKIIKERVEGRKEERIKGRKGDRRGGVEGK